MRRERAGALAVAAGALLWSLAGVGIKAVPDAPLTVTFYRSLFAAIALFVVVRKPLPLRANVLVAVVSYAACLTTFVIATKWTTAANAIFLQYLSVIWVALLSPLIVHERVHSRDVIAVIAALTGMECFFLGHLTRRGMHGNLMAVLSSIFFAVVILSLRREQTDARAIVAWGNAACVLLLLPFTPLQVTARSIAILAFLGVAQLAAGYVLFSYGIARIRATQASLIAMIEPICNPMWVLLLTRERPSSYTIIGAVIVLTTIIWHS